MFEIILAIFLMALSVIVVFKLTQKKEINRIISFSIVIMFIIWYLIPLLSTLYNWSVFGQDSMISYQTYLKYTAIDLTYFLIITLGFLIFVKEKEISTFYKNEFQKSGFLKYFFYFSVINIALVILTSNELDYSELNDLTVSKGIFYNTISFFSTYSISFLILMILFYRDKISKVKYIIAHIIFFLYSVKMTLLGGRINLLGPILIYLFLYIYDFNKKVKLLVAIPVIAFSLLAITLLPFLATIRTEGKIKLSDISTNIFENNNIDELIAQFAIKTNSVYYGSYLCEYDGIGAAGINPYINSLYTLVPRFLYPEKPVPTSKDGTEYGTPSRVAAYLIIGGADVFNVGVPPSLIALWHGGIWAYLFNIGFTIWLLLWLNKLFISNFIFWQLVVLFFINIPILNFYITFDQFLRDVPRHFIMYFIFCLIYDFYKRMIRIHN